MRTCKIQTSSFSFVKQVLGSAAANPATVCVKFYAQKRTRMSLTKCDRSGFSETDLQLQIFQRFILLKEAFNAYIEFLMLRVVLLLKIL